MLHPICTSCDCFPCACGAREYRERPELVRGEVLGLRAERGQLRAENVQAAQFVADAVRAAIVDSPFHVANEIVWASDYINDAADAAVEAIKTRKTIRLRRWKVEVNSEGGATIHYTVIAVNELDARTIAFAIDGGLNLEMESSDIEAVKMYTSILEVSSE